MNSICDELLDLLWQTTWQSTIVLLMILLMRGLFGRWIGSRWKHSLWGLLLVRLLLPVLPQNRFSVYAGSYRVLCSCEACVAHVLDPRSTATQASHLPGEKRAGPASPAVFTVVYGDSSKAGRLRNPSPGKDHRQLVSDRSEIAESVWLLIALGAIVFRIAANHRFVRRLRTSNAACLPRVILATQSAGRELRLARLPKLIVTDQVEAPAVTGVLRPTVLLPIGLAEQLSDEQLRLVLLHELSHIKCGDIAMDWLWVIAQSAHWFNPMLWLISPLRRTDREMARDEMVLRLAGPQKAECYGRTLIELSRPARLMVFCPGLIGMAADGRGLRLRVWAIARFNLQAGRSRWLVGVGLLIVAGCGLLTSPKAAVSGSTVAIAAERPSAPNPATRNADTTLLTRRYDMNDLLFVPPDYANAPDLSLKEGAAKKDDGLSAVAASASTPATPDRSQRLEDLRKYIIDNVDPDSWKENGGSTGAIDSSPGQTMFLITQTAAAHAKIQAVLDDLRASHGRQISVECRFVSVEDSTEKKLPAEVRSRLASVRNAGRYRRDEFLTDEHVKLLLHVIEGDKSSSNVTAPRLTLFNGQTAVLVVASQQAYVGGLKEVRGTGNGTHIDSHYEPDVRTCTAEGIVEKIMVCTAPDNRSVFVEIHDQLERLLALSKEQCIRNGAVVGEIQRPVELACKLDAACGIPDRSTLLLSGTETIDSGDPKFNADSPSRAATDAKVKQLSEQQSHRHLYVLIEPRILALKPAQATGTR
jgi:beta-lactamase regulating signal transducer with metallopeptidase domain